VAYQNQIVMEETLDAALERIFPGGRRPAAVPAAPAVEGEGLDAPAPPASASADVDMSALAAQARTHYQRALQAQREGNWAQYGEEIKRLGDVLAKMKR
jgi:uncharacterized membrane protein (UPF0182 family)